MTAVAVRRTLKSGHLLFVACALGLALTVPAGAAQQAPSSAAGTPPASGAGSGGQQQSPAGNIAQQAPAQQQSGQANSQSKDAAGQQQAAPAQQPAPSGQKTPPPAPAPGNLQLEAPEVAPAPAKRPELQQPQKPSEGPAEAKPAPNVIQGIVFRGNRRIPSSNLQSRIFSRPGDQYDENGLERDYMALWNMGNFDDIRLEVSDGARGKIVTFFLREKKLVRSIKYTGLNTVTTSDVLDRFREAKVGLSIESQYDPVVVRRAEVVIQQMLAEHGRQFATVRHRTRNIPPNAVELTFAVVEGPKVKVGEIKFVGNTVFSNDRLIRAMKYSKPFGAPPWFYWFHKTYDKEKIQADLEQVRELYQEHGYFFAMPSFEFKTHTVDTEHSPFLFFLGKGRGKRVDVTVPIDEGAQYRLGRFTVRGNKLFKTDALVRSFPIKQGQVFDLTRVKKSLDDYKKLYGNFGYINFVGDPDIEPDRRRHIINLTLDFDEGDQYFVHRIEFTGNNKTRDKVIRREILLDEGNLFSTALWDISIVRINQLGYFDVIKNTPEEKDYDITQNNQNKTVDILVKVKEKGKNSIGFSGGVSGIAGTFIGINYATNNLFGLGETFSVQATTGTYQKLYSIGFTKPYLWDKPITAGFNVFVSDYHFDQLRQIAAISGYNPNAIAQTPFTSALYQNFQQNSKGFSVFATTPLHRSFARLGLNYSFSDSTIETFSAASQQFYSALAFGQFNGPNQLSGIKSSTIAPSYTYSNLNGNPLAPFSGRFVSASLQFSGGPLGGNVNTIRPLFEGKYFHPVNHHRNTLAFHLIASTIRGYGGKVPPPFSRFYMGGDLDIRGFDPYTISPVGFFPVIGQVCNRDAKGQPISGIGNGGLPTGSCGSFTQFPYYTLEFPGGDSELVTNFEYRVPIVGPVTLAYFIDTGTAFILWPNQLQFTPTALNNLQKEFPGFPLPNHLVPAGNDNFRPRSSTGLELDVVLPVVHAPFRVYYAYNWLRLNGNLVTPPQNLPSRALFPNEATYNQVFQYFAPIAIREQRQLVGFTVARQF